MSVNAQGHRATLAQHPTPAQKSSVHGAPASNSTLLGKRARDPPRVQQTDSYSKLVTANAPLAKRQKTATDNERGSATVAGSADHQRTYVKPAVANQQQKPVSRSNAHPNLLSSMVHSTANLLKHPQETLKHDAGVLKSVATHPVDAAKSAMNKLTTAAKTDVNRATHAIATSTVVKDASATFSAIQKKTGVHMPDISKMAKSAHPDEKDGAKQTSSFSLGQRIKQDAHQLKMGVEGLGHTLANDARKVTTTLKDGGHYLDPRYAGQKAGTALAARSPTVHSAAKRIEGMEHTVVDTIKHPLNKIEGAASAVWGDVKTVALVGGLALVVFWPQLMSAGKTAGSYGFAAAKTAAPLALL